MKTFLYSLVLAAIMLVVNSCSTTDDYLSEFEVRRMIEDALRENNQNIEFTQWEIINITVNSDDWQWNDNTAQWEVFYELPELSEFIYEDGALIAYVFIGDQGVNEVQKLLPYLNTYSTEVGGEFTTFTEYISADYQYGNPSTVGFSIKDSELAMDPEAPLTYNFRVVLIW